MDDAYKARTRPHWIPSIAFYNLNQACAVINKSFDDGFGCYLVGSSLVRRDYRDVDVRYILDDATFDRLFRNGGDADDALWSLMCQSIATWLAQQTSLPIDFQIQRRSDANEKHPGPRSALGNFLDYPGERPSDL